ncbi:MAG: LIC12162 family protein, partial [Elusimicrobia bacterium]|nr:LIC12162 family protein [Elusimicrobiota bacterium]
GLAGLHGQDEFRRLLIATLPRALPAVALEGFAAARRSSPARRGPVPGAVMASTGWFYDDSFKLAAAEWAERGARLWGLQHGGQYGMAKYSLAESFERSLCERYFTWGWSGLDGDKRLSDLPLPAARAAARAGRGDDIVVLTLENVKNTHHLFPHPLGWQWQEHFAWLERLLAALTPELSRVRLRFYPHDYGWGHRRSLRQRFPALRADDSGLPLAKRAAKARLLISDYPGTPFLELLALDVPSIHFWNERLWETRDSALPDLDALRRAGILHSDPESAARKALEVAADPRRWWEARPARSARARLVEHFCRRESGWLKSWRRALLDGTPPGLVP